MEQGYQKLGKKTLILFIAQKSGLFNVFISISVLSLIIGNLFGENIYSFLNNTFSLNLEFGSIFNYIALISFIISLITLGIGFLIGWLKYINYEFALKENSLKIKRGIISKEEISIPYQRIQNIDLDRSLSFRLLKLSRLIILTAGHEEEDTTEKGTEPEGYLPALDYRFASKIQEELLRRSSIERVVMEKTK